ncbi:DNA mismatch repair protein Mlh3 [Etheostoma cragini]|uniref:DNA mismatch repair protein Mlh3 n=1 Tax=Etheostoma cragini TaxID=417921 RepID=UPI00155E408E|nr:DNA mismatch repair protein Mlh3 [Etheostoma cragini]
MIKCLTKEVQGKLRSGVAIPSLQQCLEELILNSIDAQATCVGVRMDMEAYKVQVIDNGAGINAEDMELVGNRYHTSKCSSVEDLDNLRWYGFRGEALASLVSLATLVEISSRTRSSVKTHVKIFKDGKGMDVFEADTARPSAGTTVVICNFLHNMPVRRKRMDAVLEGERIRHRVEAISLMHPSVSFTLKNDCTGAMMVQLPKARNTYHRFIQMHSLGRGQKLGEISYTHGQFEVTGYIGKEGHYNNSLQFLYVNDRLLLKTRMHKLLNFLLRRLSSSNQKNGSPDGQSTIRSPKHKRSQELHGVYIINIKCSYSEYDICLEPAKTLIEFKDWDRILLCIEEAVKAFMSRENLVAELSQEDLDYLPPELFGTHNTDSGNGASTLDCSFGMKLASEPVHRKRKDDCVCEDSVSRESGQMEGKEDAEQQGEKKITVNEFLKIKSEGSINKEYRYESQCDLGRLELTTDNHITEEVEPTFSEAEEGSAMLCMSNSVRQLESKKIELSKEKVILLNNATSTSNVTSLDNIAQQIQSDLNSIEKRLPDCQSAGGHEHTLVSNRKISLSDPYIHKKLQTQDLSQINKTVFQQQILAQKCETKSFASKRKISLQAGNDRICQKPCKDFTPIIPPKFPRLATCQKLALCKESGSLEKFRRVYGKSDELKLSSQETQNNTRLSRTDGFVLNSQNLLVCQKDQQNGGVLETEETRSILRGPPTLSAFTGLKLVSRQNRGKTSLAAKLNHLKQHRTDDSKVLAHLSRTALQDNTCHSGNDGSQDSNNKDNDCGLNPEPVPGCRTNPLPAEKEVVTTSGDWLHHYDTSVGKTVYVNKVTGLSRYEDPPAEDTQVCCTSDVSNMAVSVISETGMEPRCYPFQIDLVLPFLPKSRTDRVISSGLDDRGTPQTDLTADYANSESSNSLALLYSKWNNPVFVRPPTVGVDISSGQADGLAVKIHNILFPYRFSKAMICSMKVIHQVDKKFLACLINTREGEPAALNETEGNLLVLVDQHAAHERVRLEHLVADSYENDPDAPGEKRLCSSTIFPPLEISVTEEELRLLRSCQAHLQCLGLEVKFSQTADPHIFVRKVPLCFMEKESNEIRRGRPSVIKPIVEEYLQEQIELLRSTGRMRGTLPLTVLKVLASLACHGAIKFNDSLSRDECHSLVASLSSCQLPFQCAHGRPSIAPLVDTLHLDKDEKELQKPNLQKLRRMYKAWELYGNR